SLNGTNWTGPTLVVYLTGSYPVNYLSYWGYLSAVTFTDAGAPVVVYSQMNGFFSYVPWAGTYGQPVVLGVAIPDTDPTGVLSIRENGLAPGTAWQVAVDSFLVNTTYPEVNVTNVPLGLPIWVFWPGHGSPAGYRTLVEPFLSEGPVVVLSGPATVYLNF